MKRCLLLTILFILFLSCEDNTPRLTIPYAPVNFTVDLNSYDYSLRESLSFKIFTETERRFDSDRFGYAGLLVVADVTGSTIYAYDLCCPYEDNRNIKVEPTGDGKAICYECKSVFDIMRGHSGLGFGTPVSGPSEEPLQSYLVYSSRPGVYEVVNSAVKNK
ncbi:MAG TPA: hypothetical protein DEB12_00730 [Porphyromonadaceae bacterium]|jgi:hypothetical protein|nr:hypothetical protein [Porphyromonadaceae bacterium]